MAKFNKAIFQSLSTPKEKAEYLMQFDVTCEIGMNNETLTPVFIAMAAGKVQLPDKCSKDTEEATIAAGKDYLEGMLCRA